MFVVCGMAGVACGGARSVAKTPTSALSIAESGAGAELAMESMVAEASATVQVDSLRRMSLALRERVATQGGKVEEIATTDEREETLRLRILPETLQPTLDWLETQGEVSLARIKKTDISETLVDTQLTLDSHRKTLARMQALLATPDLDIDAILKIEVEMNRIRTKIEVMEGVERLNRGRVEMAVLTVTIVEEYPPPGFGVRLTHLQLLAPKGRRAQRQGMGFLIKFPMHQRFLWALDLFQPKEEDESWIYSASVGAAGYFDSLGGGNRQFFNPYLGGKMGYGYLDGHKFVLSAEAGVELWKSGSASVDLNVQATSFVGQGGPEVAVISAAEVSLQF